MTLLPGSTDVLIVGAGPAGLAMAASLAQLGVDCVVIDRKPELATGSKAAAVQPRTLEYLHRLGVAAPLIDDGLGRSAAAGCFPIRPGPGESRSRAVRQPALGGNRCRAW